MLQKEKQSTDEFQKKPKGGSGFEFTLPEIEGDGTESTEEQTEVVEEKKSWEKNLFSGLSLGQEKKTTHGGGCGCFGD